MLIDHIMQYQTSTAIAITLIAVLDVALTLLSFEAINGKREWRPPGHYVVLSGHAKMHAELFERPCARIDSRSYRKHEFSPEMT